MWRAPIWKKMKTESRMNLLITTMSMVIFVKFSPPQKKKNLIILMYFRSGQACPDGISTKSLQFVGCSIDNHHNHCCSLSLDTTSQRICPWKSLDVNGGIRLEHWTLDCFTCQEEGDTYQFDPFSRFCKAFCQNCLQWNTISKVFEFYFKIANIGKMWHLFTNCLA